MSTFFFGVLEPEERRGQDFESNGERYLEEQSCYPRDDMLIELVKRVSWQNSKMK